MINNMAPPPIPTVSYHVAVNGQATGPYDIQTLSQLASAGSLTSESLVWKTGMAAWERAGSVIELQSLFNSTIPPIPSEG